MKNKFFRTVRVMVQIQQLNQYSNDVLSEYNDQIDHNDNDNDIEEAQLAETDYTTYVYEEEETDSAKIFFGDDSEKEEELDVSPTIGDQEFVERNEAISALLDECMQPLLNRIEEQSEMLLEKDREIEEISVQLRLLPDLEKQVRVSEDQLKDKHFENEALKKQLTLTKEDQKTSDQVTKLSNALIERIEKKATNLQEEMEILKQENSLLKDNNERLSKMNRPWWHKLLSSLKK